MNQTATISHTAQQREPKTQSQRAKDTSPWLAITGPVLIALTVLVVSLLSKASF